MDAWLLAVLARREAASAPPNVMWFLMGTVRSLAEAQERAVAFCRARKLEEPPFLKAELWLMRESSSGCPAGRQWYKASLRP